MLIWYNVKRNSEIMEKCIFHEAWRRIKTDLPVFITPHFDAIHCHLLLPNRRRRQLRRNESHLVDCFLGWRALYEWRRWLGPNLHVINGVTVAMNHNWFANSVWCSTSYASFRAKPSLVWNFPNKMFATKQNGIQLCDPLPRSGASADASRCLNKHRIASPSKCRFPNRRAGHRKI